MSRILVVEDSAVNRELMRELLERRGYAVAEACNGEEALQMIEEATPDLVFLDIQMPVLDGFDVVRQLRKDPRYADLRVVALTAYAMAGDRERVLSAGFDGYLTKPIDRTALAGALKEFLG